MKNNISELVGKTVGRLTVVEIIETTTEHKRTKYTLKCICKCGTLCYHKVSRIIGNYPILSCGCLRKEKWAKAYYTWLKNQEIAK